MNDEDVEALVFDNGKVHVRSAACDHCLFSKDRLVSGKRARDIISSARAEVGGSFVCHRSSLHEDEHDAICRVYWDAFAQDDWVLRLANSMNIIKWVSND